MKRHFTDFIITFLAGALYALAYPSFLGGGFFPFLLIALPLFLWKIEESSFHSSLYLIFGFNLGLNFIGYYWIPHTLREFGQLPFALSILLGSLASIILQPHWWVYSIWRKFRPQLNWSSNKNILVSAFILTLMERFVPQQFPSYVGSTWLHLAPYLGLAPYFGVAVFSFMTYWISLELINQFKAKKTHSFVWILFITFVLLNVLFPLKPSLSNLKLNTRIVQANIGNFLKITSEQGDQDSYEAVVRTYEDLSTQENEFRPELIIWPETAFPHTFEGLQSQLDKSFERILQKTGAEILIGGYDQDPSKNQFDFYESVFNSSLLISENRIKSIYHKNILIPFGETLPFGQLNRQIVTYVPAISLFASGKGTPKMETKSGFRFVTPICYEILETNFMRHLLNEWGENYFIVNHTNDSWYGETAEPYQHLFLSKWRALEFQLPIIRSTNTGISSVIFPDGSESKRLEINQIGKLDVIVPIEKSNGTIYLHYGIYPFLLLFAVLYLLTWWFEKRQIRP
jgi:apolipoprotein N-acyltransferase